MNPAEVEFFTDKRGKERNRLVAGNNRIVDSSQGYKNHADLESNMYLKMISYIEYFRKKGMFCNNIDCTFEIVKPTV